MSGYIKYHLSENRRIYCLKKKIKETFSKSRSTYGHRRVKKELKKQGISSSNNRIRRLMKELNLVPIQTRKYKATTNSKHSLPVAPNLLNKDFKADAPCRKWVETSPICPRKVGYT